ncbi:MAG: M3 family oligoendopeptidase [Candidatus Dormibacteraeota bacterium]|nr:M3 family oligoendopeptidase [Candidatus Dormibacteraeota bacterium]
MAALPPSPAAFEAADWSAIAPYFDELAARPLDDLEGWLHDWSELEKLIGEASVLAEIAYTTDTGSEAKEAAHLRWSSDILPLADEQQVRLARRLVEHGQVPEGLEVTIRRFRNRISLFREANVPLQGEEARDVAAYERVTGQMLAEWDGERLPVAQVEARQQEPDRALRERAYRAACQPYIDARDELSGIFDRLQRTRQQIARNAGFASFRDYQHRAFGRFDYTPDDCLRWHEAVEEVVVPARKRSLRGRQAALGVDPIRPWDLSVDPQGRPPLHPFTEAPGLIGGVRSIFEHLDPDLGAEFRILDEEHLLDLDSRPGKAPGGYCAPLPHRARNFIFMNAAGTQKDVFTLLHESGHAFHSFASERLPYVWQNDYPMEIAEVASMSMELLGGPGLARSRGGFYEAEQDVSRARAENLEDILGLLCHIASVDAFQHWLYTDPAGTDPDARDAQWLRLRERFEPLVDFSGLRAQRVARWYRQLHIFEAPFYYIEYGLAQLGALQVWRNSLRDPARALSRYREMLALGNTRPLPELYRAAGARLIFDAEGMRELIELLEEELARLEG